MTYFGFLAIFLIVPILILLALARRDAQHGLTLPAAFGAFSAKTAVLLHVIIALIYTTPWDNYLVATRVWWYDPNLVTGIVFGWVPIEEYTFFILQPIFTGLWLLFWLRRYTGEAKHGGQTARTVALMALTAVWLIMIGILITGWQPGTYLALELGWALPPILLQIWFGGHVLWQHRRLVLTALVPPTIYLALADTLAIRAGTWTIDPAQSLHWLIGGILPIEELIFFLLTNTLVVFGMTLLLAASSQTRLNQLRQRLRRKLQPQANQSS